MFIKGKVLITLAIFILIGCKKDVSYTKHNTDNGIDSVLFYYRLSKNKSKKPKVRLNAITRSYELAKKANNDSLIIKTLTYKSLRHNLEKQYDSAVLYSKKLLHVSNASKDSAAIGNAYFKLGIYNNKLNRSDSAFYYYNQSKNIYSFAR